MQRFTLKVISVGIVLFFGVVLGMQLVNDGLLNMRGYNDPSIEYPNSHETENVRGTLSDDELPTHDLEAKQDRLEKVKSFNLFSSIGKALAELITVVVQGIISLVVGIFEMFNPG